MTKPGLIRALGPLMATATTVGTVIGSGVFQKPQTVADNIPYFGLVAVAWILGGLLAMFGSLAYAEVAVLFPKAGGNYVFLREGYGRLAGFLWGWVEFWIIRSASIAALATMFTKSFYAVFCNLYGTSAGEQYLGYWPQRGVTVAVILFLALVNVRGVRWGGGLQFVITLVKVGSLLAILALPFVMWSLASPGSERSVMNTDNLKPLWPSWEVFSLSAFTSALLGILWAYHGWMNIAWVAEEVRNPQRNLPLALLAGVGIVIFLYLGANLSYSLVLTQGEMSQMRDAGAQAKQTSDGLRDVIDENGKKVVIGGAMPPPEAQPDKTVAIGFARRLLGPIGVALAAAAVMCSVFGALNGNLLVGPRMLYAMSADRLAPQALGAVHPQYRTPALAILVMAGWSCLLIIGTALLTELGAIPRDKDHFDMLTNFAMFGAVIFETMAVVSIFIFRARLPNAERPYRCLGYPVVPALYVILPALILGNMFFKEPHEALTGLGFIILGTIVFYLLPKQRRVG